MFYITICNHCGTISLHMLNELLKEPSLKYQCDYCNEFTNSTLGSTDNQTAQQIIDSHNKGIRLSITIT